MTAPNKFAIVPIHCDSSGAEVKFPGAIMTGDMSAVMARIKDSRQMREDLRISNEADEVRREKQRLLMMHRALREREAAYANSVAAKSITTALVQDFIGKLDALTARMDSLEAERNHDPDDDELPLPPGIDGTDPVYDPSVLAHPQKPQQQPAAIGDEEDLPLPPGSPAPDDGELEIPKTAPSLSEPCSRG